MRRTVCVFVAIGLTAALGGAAAAERSRITSFTLSPGESLSPHPRANVETATLPPPAPPPPPKPPLAPEELPGRWTERDPAYCEGEQYLVEWTADRQRVRFGGRIIEDIAVRYSANPDGIKVERLAPTGEPIGYWLLVGIDGDHVKWVETAERRDAALSVIGQPDKLLVRCTGTAPPPGLMQRARHWWATFLDRLWPSGTPPSPTS
jgi:hypothetical protein